MVSVCWNHRLGCLASKGSSLTGMLGPDMRTAEGVVVLVVVYIGVPTCAVENWEDRLQTGEEDGDGGKAVAVATRSSSASDKSQLVNITTV